MVKLKYTNCERIVLNYGTQAFNYIHYKINSPYDPVYGIGNQSAKGFAVWAALYNFYRCYAAKIRVRFVGSDLASTHYDQIPCIWYGLYMGADRRLGQWSVDNWTMVSNGCARMRPIIFDRTRPNKRLAMYKRMKYFIQAPITDNEFIGNYNTDPTRVFYATLYADLGLNTQQIGTIAVALWFEVRITYYTKFWGKRTATLIDLEGIPPEEEGTGTGLREAETRSDIQFPPLPP